MPPRGEMPKAEGELCLQPTSLTHLSVTCRRCILRALGVQPAGSLMMYNLSTFLFLLQTAAILGWAFRPTEYKRLCREFDRVGAETIFTDANNLIQVHRQDVQESEWGEIGLWEPSNSLAAFGHWTYVGSNYVRVKTAGMGSVRMGIILNVLSNDIENGTAQFFLQHEYEYYETPIYPKEDRD